MSMGLKPGQKAPASGQYGVVGPRGGKINHEVTVTKGEPMPPTKKPGQTYVMNDPTHNKSGKP
ncbi:MAG: YjzC family protein [Oscillospiraceae bacterium]|nr:YjzC family protein [Oscillospiraceae bacterium]MDY5311487.1 YjzC family protein [Oscillospiraceae bacterium]